VSDDSAVSSRISSVTMKPSSVSVIRGGGATHATVKLDKPMEFSGEVSFNAGTALGSLDFGFFQIGRPFEVYKAIWTNSSGGTSSDIMVDETAAMRKELPAQDHAGVFFHSTGMSAVPTTDTIDDKAKTVKVKYVDTPGTPFQIMRPSNGVDYRLSKLDVMSFFFTGFGLVRNGKALILGTRYWTMRYCEEIPSSTDLSKDGSVKKAVEVTPLRDGRTHSCDLGEPGARDANGNAPGWGNPADQAKTFAYVANTVASGAMTRGPGTFDKKC
jgi:hypothetical protein